MEQLIIALALVLTMQSAPVYADAEIAEIRELCFAHEGKQRFDAVSAECMSLLPSGNWVTIPIDLRNWEYENVQPSVDNDTM